MSRVTRDVPEPIGTRVAPRRTRRVEVWQGLELEASRGVEVDSGRQKVIEGAECNGVRTTSDGKERVVETNAPCRDRGPGGHRGEGGQGQPEAPKRWDRCRIRWERVPDGWRNEQCTSRVETTQDEDAS